MSLVAFKKKSVIQYGSKRSGKPPGGYWLPQGPFGASTVSLKQAIEYPGSVGFSLNGTHRNTGYVGKESKFSKNGTPFRGVHPDGWGGYYGQYKKTEPVYNINKVIGLGEQWLYVKPTVPSIEYVSIHKPNLSVVNVCFKISELISLKIRVYANSQLNSSSSE